MIDPPPDPTDEPDRYSWRQFVSGGRVDGTLHGGAPLDGATSLRVLWRLGVISGTTRPVRGAP